MARAALITQDKIGKPYSSSAGALNTYIYEYLASRYATEAIDVDKELPQDWYMPLWTPDRFAKIRKLGSLDLAVYCEEALYVESLGLVDSKQHTVFFHSLGGDPFAWFMRGASGVTFCGNSRWTRDAVRAIAGYPLWDEGRLLVPDIVSRTRYAECALPSLEGIGGDTRFKGTLPQEIHRYLEDDSIVGIDFAKESDLDQHLALIVALNATARDQNDRRLVRLIGLGPHLDPFRKVLERPHPTRHRPYLEMLAALQLSLTDILVSAPVLDQSELFQLMRQAKFMLAFNKIPESFGLTPLEATLNGCPTYTNGCGNLRNLLPPGHGIVVHDTFEMSDLSVPEVMRVAVQIYDDVRGGDSSICKRGVDLIRSAYSRTGFYKTLAKGFEPAEPGDLRSCIVSLSPFVRKYDRDSRRVLSDYSSCQLTPRQAAGLDCFLGLSQPELLAISSPEDCRTVSQLWRWGILGWSKLGEDPEQRPHSA